MLIDPGIGFGKTPEHKLEILCKLGELSCLNRPILVGTSRKSFIGRVLGLEAPEERIWGTAATMAMAVAAGGHILRVHDVAQMAQVARMAYAVRSGQLPKNPKH